jgi:hypothetical protein
MLRRTSRATKTISSNLENLRRCAPLILERLAVPCRLTVPPR